MSNPITIRGLQTLLAPHPGPCISLYLPTHRRLPQAKQHSVRFKNLMLTTEGLLRKENTGRDTKTLLQPLEDLARDDFWHAQMGGLAIVSFLGFADALPYVDALSGARMCGRRAARELIAESETFTPKDLEGLLPVSNKT